MGIGRTVLGGASAALGIIGLTWGAFAFAWQPVPPDLPGYTPLAYLAGATLLLGGIGLLVDRVARLSAPVLGLVYAAFAIPWAIRTARFPQMFGTWGGLAEQISIILALVIIFRAVARQSRSADDPVVNWCVKAFGICAIVFGFNHFLALEQTASMVPKWLPPGAMFWAVATGVFHCAAGVALVAGIRSLLAARLLAAMMLVFEALVWLPYLLKSPGTHMIWAGNATDVALAGAALVIADALALRQTLRESGHADTGP